MKQVAIQGAPGSFHEMAAQQYFGEAAEPLYCETFADVFDQLQAGAVDTAILAIGNSRFGDINRVYETLIHNHQSSNTHKYWISGEVYVAVELCLVGLPGASVKSISEVHSQAPALGQCFDFLHHELYNATVVEQDDTARSAELVSQWHDPTKAAIASRAAARKNGLEVLASNIQDDLHNVTRFLVITTRKPKSLKDCTKTSLLLRSQTSNLPGSLAQALLCFSESKINLSYLQSVPIPSKPFMYNFYIDIDAGTEATQAAEAYSKLNSIGYEVDILGSYQKAKLPHNN